MNVVDWIEVGKVSAERDRHLVGYFYDNGMLRSVLENPQSFLFLGRKGAGKTAVFQYLTKNSSHFLTKDDFLVALSFEDFNWQIHSILRTSGAAESLAYKDSWKFVILAEATRAYAAKCLVAGVKCPQSIINAQKLLERLFGTPAPSMFQLIGRKLLGLSSVKFPKAGLELEEGEFASVEVSGGEITFEDARDQTDIRTALTQNVEHLTNVLERAFESARPLRFRIVLCFDRVDEAWDDVSFDVSRRVLAGLVIASDSITMRHDGKIRPIVFLRDDIFSVLPLNDANKLREDCGKLLQWGRRDLFDLLLRRLSFYAGLSGVAPLNALNDAFDWDVSRHQDQPETYLLKRTMMRPRDMICIMSRTISAMKSIANDPFKDDPVEHKYLSMDAIYDAEPGYSEWLKQELYDEWEVQHPKIRVLLDAIQNHGKMEFSSDELKSQLANLGLILDDLELVKELRFLFDSSVIAVQVGEAWRHKCFYPSQGFVPSRSYRVHDGLAKALSLPNT